MQDKIMKHAIIALLNNEAFKSRDLTTSYATADQPRQLRVYGRVVAEFREIRNVYELRITDAGLKGVTVYQVLNAILARFKSKLIMRGHKYVIVEGDNVTSWTGSLTLYLEACNEV